MACSARESADDSTLTVFAASSLVDAFTEIGAAFEVENPGSRVRFSFASSSDLAAQVVEGAPADVFASADTMSLDTIRARGVALSNVHVFATNSLEIMVEPENPFGIQSLEDLADPNLVFIACDSSVPIGRYSTQVLTKAGVDLSPKSYEENVKGIVTKIVLGEADAGIVYRTDIIAAGSSAHGIPIPAEFNIVAEYPIATIGSVPSELAKAFVDFVTLSRTARDILISYGFTES